MSLQSELMQELDDDKQFLLFGATCTLTLRFLSKKSRQLRTSKNTMLT